MKLRFESHSEAETIRLGSVFAGVLRPGDVIALHGELGAGKTRLVRGIATGLGVPASAVSSPTYVIAQEYLFVPGVVEGKVWRVVHVDAYRLRGEDELESAGWDLLMSPVGMSGERPIVIVEWAERIARAIARFGERAEVTLCHLGVTAREGLSQEHSVVGGASLPSTSNSDESEAPGRRMIEMELPDAWRNRAAFAGLESLAARDDGASRGRTAITCRITGKMVPADSPTYPFFDEKARLADLNRWMTGGYAISREVTADDVEDVSG